jgi:hypothetical protein
VVDVSAGRDNPMHCADMNGQTPRIETFSRSVE